ncbi:hypothetical protein B0H14DRAFT_2573890 [Mycena olivaceomarginata]|nr:hypothetical protein B0H14DRAFT_2573890 [Mycena olivaceomarginata]
MTQPPPRQCRVSPRRSASVRVILSNIPAGGKFIGGHQWPPLALGGHWQISRGVVRPQSPKVHTLLISGLLLLSESSRIVSRLVQQNHEHVQLHKLSIRGFNGAAHVPRASLTTEYHHTQRSSFQHTSLCSPRCTRSRLFSVPHNRDDFSWCTCHISGDGPSARDVRGKSAVAPDDRGEQYSRLLKPQQSASAHTSITAQVLPNLINGSEGNAFVMFGPDSGRSEKITR